MKTKALLLMALLFLTVTLSPLKVSHGETSWSKPATVDSTDNAGMECSLAMDSAGNPHISYWIYPNMDLKYIRISDGEWSIPATLDKDGIVGMYSSLALDSADNPHITYYYYEQWAGSSIRGILKYIRMSDGEWDEPVTLDSGDVGLWSSLALDSADNPHISYYDDTNGDLKYIRMNDGEWLEPVTLDSTGNVGKWPSLALDSNDNAHISYYDEWNQDLKYIRMSDGVWSEPVTLDSTGNVGRFSSLALDSADNAHISYYDYTKGDLKYLSSHPGYDVRINAWSTLGEASLPITMDGVITGFNTSYLFEGLEGTHNFTLPETANDYPFTEWTKSGSTIATTRTITITSGGTYNAQYTISPTAPPEEPPIMVLIAVGIAIGVVVLSAGLLFYIKLKKRSGEP